MSDDAERLAADYLKKAEQVPLIVEAMNRSAERGSNSWVIGGQHTATGKPILASDPHLTLEAPSTLQPIDLQGGGFDAQGDSLPGTPYLILGQNRDITYGATQHFVDVTDTYTEKIQPDPASPSGLSTAVPGQARAGRGHRREVPGQSAHTGAAGRAQRRAPQAGRSPRRR